MLPETKSTSRAQVKWPVTMNTDEGTADGVITNINNNGAFIRCRRPLRLTETCKLTIVSSDRQIEDVLAEVVWTNIYGPDDDLTPRGMGVRFTGLPEAELSSFTRLGKKRTGEFSTPLSFLVSSQLCLQQIQLSNTLACFLQMCLNEGKHASLQISRDFI
ncbi:MAG: PilZ domain-containing protein [Deltaproteobacteria bacterium]